MTMNRYIASGIAAAGLLSSSAAFAADATRSAAALPTNKIALKRVAGVNRAAKSAKDANHAIETAPLVLLLVAGGAVAAGIVVVATDSNG